MIANFIAIKREEVRIVGEMSEAESLAYYLPYI
jgi:glutamine synthetase